jgi:hypothetical protein
MNDMDQDLEGKIDKTLLNELLRKCTKGDFPLVVYHCVGPVDESLLRIGIETADKKEIYLSDSVSVPNAHFLATRLAKILDNSKCSWDIDYDLRGFQMDIRDALPYHEWLKLQHLEGINKELQEYSIEDLELLERGLINLDGI